MTFYSEYRAENVSTKVVKEESISIHCPHARDCFFYRNKQNSHLDFGNTFDDIHKNFVQNIQRGIIKEKKNYSYTF